MPSRRTSVLLLVAVTTPLFSGAVSVAAGHVVPSYLPFYIDRLDSAIILANAAIGPTVAAAAMFSIMPRRPIGIVIAVLWFLASLPAYSIAYHCCWHWFSDFGIGMTW